MTDQAHALSAAKASSCALDAARELLRFQTEGFSGPFPFDDEPEPVASLAEALFRAAAIERSLFPGEHEEDVEYRDGVGQLAAACSKFLADHCGREVT